ncbi:MAG: hypothetical protein H6Q62_569 [Firmicutes bacterium]|nr:hypothetical protein [Bacillota bacterium]
MSKSAEIGLILHQVNVDQGFGVKGTTIIHKYGELHYFPPLITNFTRVAEVFQLALQKEGEM